MVCQLSRFFKYPFQRPISQTSQLSSFLLFFAFGNSTLLYFVNCMSHHLYNNFVFTRYTYPSWWSSSIAVIIVIEQRPVTSHNRCSFSFLVKRVMEEELERSLASAGSRSRTSNSRITRFKFNNSVRLTSREKYHSHGTSMAYAFNIVTLRVQQGLVELELVFHLLHKYVAFQRNGQRIECLTFSRWIFMELELAIEFLYATNEIETLFGLLCWQ